MHGSGVCLFVHICVCPRCTPALQMGLINLGKESSWRGILFLQKGRCSSSSPCLATSTYRCGKGRELEKWSEVPQRPPGRQLADSPRKMWRRSPSPFSAPMWFRVNESLSGFETRIGKRSGKCMSSSTGLINWMVGGVRYTSTPSIGKILH